MKGTNSITLTFLLQAFPWWWTARCIYAYLQAPRGLLITDMKKMTLKALQSMPRKDQNGIIIEVQSYIYQEFCLNVF